jgi:hypothetical protein
VLGKTLDSTTMSHDKLELATLSKAGDQVRFSVLNEESLKSLLASIEAKAPANESKDKASSSAKDRL